MSTISYATKRPVAPSLGALGSEDPERQQQARLAASVPLIIAVGVELIFFLQFWLPETSRFPTRHWWLTQLAPLASPTLTSSGQSQVTAQDGPWGLGAVLLLLASVAIFIVCRSPRLRFGPWVLAAPFGLGLITGLSIVVVLLVSGRLGQSFLSVLLIVAWLVAAGFATAGKIFDAPLEIPEKRWRDGLPLLIAYAILGPLPTAVGRWLFAPELRDVAAGLQQNRVAFRLAALWTPTTLMFYLCGLAVGVAIWVVYHWWPPQRSIIRLSAALIGLLVAIGALGWPTASLAEQRTRVLLDQSPMERVHFPCGAWRLEPLTATPSAQPPETAVLSGFSCKTLTTYSGYRQIITQTLPATLSPVQASTPEGGKIQGRYVAAQYGSIMVVAGSDRLTSDADQLFGIGVHDGVIRWHVQCGEQRSRPLAVRFAKVPTGDDPARGFVTRKERGPRVVVACEGRTVSFDPAKGPPR